MKTNMLGMAVAVALTGVMVAQTVSAAHIEIQRYAGYRGSNGGGEFTVYGTGYETYYSASATYNDAANQRTGFQTFCLERNENVVVNPDHNYTIEHYAIAGGLGGIDVTVGGDPLSIGTAWLYRQFSDGILAGYDYDATSGRSVTATDLQQAFWMLENEYLVSDARYDLNNQFIVLAIGHFSLNISGLQQNANPGEYGVAAINWTEDGLYRQSMLVRVPDGGLTVVLLGLGTLGCAALRRRMA